jgi:hypothetical protein
VVVEVSDDVNTREIVGAAAELRLRFLVVPVDCGSRVGRDTVRKGGRFGDNDVNSEICRGAGIGGAEVAWREEHADISRAGWVVGDQVSWFGGDAVSGGDKVGPGADVRADDMEGVPDVSTEG